MKTIRRWQNGVLAGVALLLGTLTGCQTYIAGMTLPTGHYLEHPPQYFQPAPVFPLPRELAAMEADAARQGPAAAVPAPAPLPPQVPQPPIANP
jgi:hypothetical protein